MAEPANQCRGFARPGWAKDQQALIEGQTENLILVLVQNRLIPKPHLRDDAAAHTFNDVGSFAFLRQQLLQQIFGDFLSGDFVEKRAKRLDGEGAKIIRLDNRVAGIPAFSHV